MTATRIYHNPRCSKSRATLALLQAQGCHAELVDYLADPPSTSELDAICSQLGVEPLAIIRTGESCFKELGLSSRDDRPRAEWLELMVANPILIERPILTSPKGAAIGRPPENVLQIL